MSGPGSVARTVLAALVVALLAGAPALVLSERSLDEARALARAEALASAARAAQAGAEVVTARVLGTRSALGSAAQSLLVQYGAARKDRAVLAGILADLRPLIGAPQDVQYVFLVDPGGSLLAADPPAPELVDQPFAQRDWFAAARDGRPAASEVYASGFRGTPPAVIVAVPVRDGFGRPAGVLAAAIDLSRAADWFTAIRGPSAPMRLLDAGGAPIAGDAAAAGGEPLVASAPVAELGWRVQVARSAEPIDRELAPLALASRALLGALVVLLFAATAALGIAGARLATRAREVRLATDALAAAERHRSVFLDRLSQGLRTPLNSIVGFSGLLEEELGNGALPEGQRRWLRNIRVESAQLLSLTSDALDLSAVEAGGVELRPREIAIAELVAPVRDAAEAAAGARDVGFRHEVAAAVVRVDVERVRQVLEDLLGRALRGTPAGGHVSLAAALDGAALSLVVTAAGVGLPAERADRVREALAGLPDLSDEPGASLALAVAARLVAWHGGSIAYDCPDTRTATFRVRLPGVRVTREVADATAGR